MHSFASHILIPPTILEVFVKYFVVQLGKCVFCRFDSYASESCALFHCICISGARRCAAAAASAAPGRAAASKWTNIIVLFPPFNRLIRCAAASLPPAARRSAVSVLRRQIPGNNGMQAKTQGARSERKRNNNGIWPEHLFAYFVIIYIRLMGSDSVGRQITPAPHRAGDGTRKAEKQYMEFSKLHINEMDFCHSVPFRRRARSLA